MIPSSKLHKRYTAAVSALVIMLMLPGIITAQQNITGRLWSQWDESRKVIFLARFYAGLLTDMAVFAQAEQDYSFRQPTESNPVSVDRYKAERREYYSDNLKYDFNMIRQLLDVFYTDPDNLLIPVTEAIRIIALRADGNLERSEFLLMRERRKALEGQ